MFNIDKWKAKISNSYKSKDLTDGLDNLEKSISQYLIPTLSQIDDSRDFNSDFYKKWGTYYLDELKHQNFKFKGETLNDTIDLMFRVAGNLLVVLPWLRHELKGKVITVEGLELRTANLLQLIDLVDYTVDYMTNFTNLLSCYEVQALGGESNPTPVIGDKLADEAWVFVTACTVFLKPLNDIKAAYGRIPALIADYDKFQELSQTIGLSKVDPLNLSAPPFPLSLLFYPQAVIADIQMNNLEKAESTYKAINYRLALMQRIKDSGESDAATEKRIEAYEKKLANTERYIQRKKEKWNLN